VSGTAEKPTRSPSANDLVEASSPVDGVAVTAVVARLVAGGINGVEEVDINKLAVAGAG
jgi:hypothetical protein